MYKKWKKKKKSYINDIWKWITTGCILMHSIHRLSIIFINKKEKFIIISFVVFILNFKSFKLPSLI